MLVVNLVSLLCRGLIPTVCTAAPPCSGTQHPSAAGCPLFLPSCSGCSKNPAGAAPAQDGKAPGLWLPLPLLYGPPARPLPPPGPRGGGGKKRCVSTGLRVLGPQFLSGKIENLTGPQKGSTRPREQEPEPHAWLSTLNTSVLRGIVSLRSAFRMRLPTGSAPSVWA